MAKVDPVVVPVQVDLTLNMTGIIESTNFDDVGEFHEKFELPNVTHDGVAPHLLDDDLFDFRLKFMQEELDEFSKAHREGRLADAFDGLLDLAYVVFGTAHVMGLPWQQGWDLVQEANMSKLRATTGMVGPRGNAEYDVIKGPDFKPPDIAGLLGQSYYLRPETIEDDAQPGPPPEDPWEKVEVYRPKMRIKRDGEE